MRFQKEIIPFSKEFQFPYMNSGFVLNNQSFGKKVPIPLPIITDKIYAPNMYIKALLMYRSWKGSRVSDFNHDDIIHLPEPFNLDIFFYYFIALASEYKTWLSHYLPPYSLKGKTVLDAGAGCGETAWFYFNHGAKKVIAVEPDPRPFKLLCSNARNNDWNIELINSRLTPEILFAKDIDFAKVDIERGEIPFIPQAKQFPPCIMETHDRYITHAYNQQGFKTVWGYRLCSLVTNVTTQP